MALSPNINNLEKDKFKDVSGATAVQVSVIETVGGGGSGTEYTEGDVDATITGPAVLAEGPSNTLTPLQLDASGNLKVSGTFGGSSSDVTEDAASLADPIGPQIMARRRDTLAAETGTDGDNVALNTTNKGELYVKHADTLTVGNTYETFSGSITAISQNVPAVFVNVRATVGLRISGTWVGTIAFQVSVNGTDYVTTEALPVASGVISTATNANGDWHIPTGGMKSFRVLSTAWTSGTATVEITACTASHVSEVYSETADNLKSQSFGSVTTADPSYVDGTTRSLSINTAGGLRIAATSLPLPTGAATAALQTQPGVDIGDVTINNASGASAVNIQDGGNSITVDGTVAVSGTVAVTQSTSPWVISGAVTNTVLSVVGGGTEATAQRVTIANDSTGVLSIDDNGGSITIDASSLPLPTGAATSALQTQPGVDIGDVTINNAAGASAVNIQDGGNSITVDGTVAVSGTVAVTQSGTWNITNISGTISLPTGAATAANQATEIASLAAIDAGIPAALGQTTMAASMPVTIASNQSAVPVSGTVTSTSSACATSTFTRTAGATSSTTVLALNANRKKAIIYNDSTSGCYLKFGSTASSTSFTYRMLRGDTLIEQGPDLWTGIITAIWDSATGSMQVTELTT